MTRIALTVNGRRVQADVELLVTHHGVGRGGGGKGIGHDIGAVLVEVGPRP